MPVFRKGGVNVLFVHIPKTGGTSIEAFFKSDGWEMSFFDPGGVSSLNHLLKCSPQHLHRELLCDLFFLEKFDYIFTVVRNPIERIRSEYTWRKMHGLDLKNLSINDWIKYAFSEYSLNNYVFDNHIRPQVDFLIPNADVFSLEQGLDRIAKKLRGIFDCGKLISHVYMPSEMVSRGAVPSIDISVSEENIDLISCFYRSDFLEFGYSYAGN